MPSFKGCNRTFRANETTFLKLSKSSPDLSPIENVWTVPTNKVAEKHFPNISALIEAIKLPWTREILEEFCKKLMNSTPRRIKVKRRPTMYENVAIVIQNRI